MPAPSCPLELSPQQKAKPSAFSVHAWLSPVEIDVHTAELPTAMATLESFDSESPLPSCNTSSCPQQYAKPESAMPHAWVPPADTRNSEIGVRASPVTTGDGVTEFVFDVTPFP